MIERIDQLIQSWSEAVIHAIGLVLIGVFVALGPIFYSDIKVTLRVAIGRCISTGGLALVAGSVVAYIPDVPLIAQFGIAAALANLGHSGIEMLMQRAIAGREKP